MLLSLINSHLPSPHLTDHHHTSPSSSLVAHTSPLASASPPMAIASGTGCCRGRRLLLLAAALLLSAASPARAFYLPGVAPRDFQKVIRFRTYPLSSPSSSDLALGGPSRPSVAADLAVRGGAGPRSGLGSMPSSPPAFLEDCSRVV